MKPGSPVLPYAPAWIALVIAAALLCAALAWALTSLRRWKERHHGFIGLVVMAIGAAFALTGWPRFGLALGVVGLAVLFDDTQSHFRQALDPTFPRSGSRGYRDAAYSPLHKLAHRIGLI